MASSGFLTPSRIALYLFTLIAVGAIIYYFNTQKPPEEVGDEATAGQIAGYISGQHPAGPAPETTDFAGLSEYFKDWVGQELQLPSFEGSGLAFKGAAESEVPGQRHRRSAHLRFETDGTKGAAGERVSLFLHGYSGFPEIPEGQSMRLRADKALGEGAPPIVVWRKGGILYFIASESLAARDLARQALSIPEPTRDY